MKRWILAALVFVPALHAADDPWQIAQKNSQQSLQALKFCKHYAQGWLSHADPTSGLLPRRVSDVDSYFWNAKDCAADNYPFLVLTGEITDSYYLKLICQHIFAQEQKLTRRVDSLSDDFVFATQSFRQGEPKMPDLIFGGAEYAKDGLIPITEWVGPSPYVDRMIEMIVDIWKHAAVDSPVGKLPSDNIEVNGDLLQAMSRLFWLTGDARFKDWTFQLADFYLLHHKLTASESLRLRDHGCEVLGGLSEAYVIAAHHDHDRRDRYRPEMHAILDCILKCGVNTDGMMYNVINPAKAVVVSDKLSDGWGYVYDAFLAVAAVDDEPRYREAVMHALCNLAVSPHQGWEHAGGADECADSIEGAINLLNRLPVESGFEWVDREIESLMARQQPDGIIEGWYGDGNSARTVWMYALYKTQGIAPSPWREDMQIGVAREDGGVRVFVKAGWPYAGKLRFDRPRHRDYLHLPMDYPRINQFPEWFTVEADKPYAVICGAEAPKLVTGKDLLAYPVVLEANKPLLLTVRPWTGPVPAVAAVTAPAPANPSAPAESAPAVDPASLRRMRYTSGSAAQAVMWQRRVRIELARLLKIDDLMSSAIPFEPKLLGVERKDGYSWREVEFNSTPGRRIRAVITIPDNAGSRRPAIICIHGHSGNRTTPYQADTPYKGFAAILASSGFVTASVDVGQHEVYELGRTLMGERLWDLERLVDLLTTLPEVDPDRIGCAGLSLGGEMAMWLGAMDPRVGAVVSAGFLTRMDQMEQHHCMCWKFPGLRELVDYADIYSLIAPRPLQCRNGQAEPPTAFTVDLAIQAMAEIKLIYSDFGKPGYVGLAVHPGGHEVDLPSMMAFFNAHLPATKPAP